MIAPDPYFLRSPGEIFPITILRYRRWWQFWRPRMWTEEAKAITPAPRHFNCRCVLADPPNGDDNDQ